MAIHSPPCQTPCGAVKKSAHYKISRSETMKNQEASLLFFILKMKLTSSNSSILIIHTLHTCEWVTTPAFRCPLGLGSDMCPHSVARVWGSQPRPGAHLASSGDSNSRTRKISGAAAFTLIDCISNSPTHKISEGADIALLRHRPDTIYLKSYGYKLFMFTM